MALISPIKDRDWVSVRQANARLSSQKLGPNSTPTFAGLTLTGDLTLPSLTDNSLIYPSGGGTLTSLGVAADGQIVVGSTGTTPVLTTITPTANQVNVANAAGSITLSTPQDIHTGAIPTFVGMILNGTTAIGLDMSGGTFATATQNWPAQFVHTSDGDLFLHNFQHLTGGGAVPNGFNTFLGFNAGNLTMGSTATETFHSSYNVGIGRNALNLNTLGQNNVAVGRDALEANLTGDDNLAIGAFSLEANISGNSNLAIGAQTLKVNTTGFNNLALGSNALVSNVGGFRNTGLGAFCLRYQASGSENTAVGYKAGEGTSGQNFVGGTFIGANSGESLTTGSQAVFIGLNSGKNQVALNDILIIDNRDRGSEAAEITDCLTYGVFSGTIASQTIRFNVGDLIQGNPTHSDADGGGAMVQSFIREDGAGTPSTAATITISHDGSDANNELGKLVLGVNTGAGVVDALAIGSDRLLEYTGNAIFQPHTDSTTAFQWLDQDGGTPILNIDTINETVGFGVVDPDTAFITDSRGRVQIIATEAQIGAGSNVLTVQGPVTGSGNFDVVRAVANTTGVSSFLHQNLLGTAQLIIRVGINNRDAQLLFDVNGSTTWAVGLDNSDSDKFKIAPASTLQTNTAVTILTTGELGINTDSPDAKLQVVGDCKFGDDNTNYTSFASDGELTLTGTARVIISQDLEPALATRPVANPPAEGTENSFVTHDFSPTTDESVFFHLELAHDYADAGLIHIHFDFFVDTAPASAESVVWGVEYKKQSIGDNFDFSSGTTTAYTQTAVTTGTPANDKKTHQSGEVSLVTTGFVAGDYILLRMFRDADSTGGTDDYSSDARVIDYHVEYLSDKLGEAI